MPRSRARAAAALTSVAVGVAGVTVGPPVFWRSDEKKPQAHARERPQQVRASPAAGSTSPTAAPPDAVYVWGPQRFALAPPTGLQPATSARAAVVAFRANAFAAPDRVGVEPETRFWLYTDQRTGIIQRPVWVLIFRDVTENAIGSIDPAVAVYDSCVQTYVVDAVTGAGVADITQCPNSGAHRQ